MEYIRVSYYESPKEKEGSYNTELEQCLLGALITWPNTIHELPAGFTDEILYFSLHKKIYRTVLELNHVGYYDLPLVCDSIRTWSTHETEILKAAGGKAYIAQMVADVLSPAVVRPYAIRLMELKEKRDLKHEALQIMQAIENDDNGKELRERVEKIKRTVSWKPRT